MPRILHNTKPAGCTSCPETDEQIPDHSEENESVQQQQQQQQELFMSKLQLRRQLTTNICETVIPSSSLDDTVLTSHNIRNSTIPDAGSDVVDQYKPSSVLNTAIPMSMDDADTHTFFHQEEKTFLDMCRESNVWISQYNKIPLLNETIRSTAWLKEAAKINKPEVVKQRLLWNIKQAQTDAFDSTIQDLVQELVCDEVDHKNRKYNNDILEIVENHLNKVETFEEADAYETDMFICKIRNERYTPVAFGKYHDAFKVVPWEDNFDSLVQLNDNQLTMLTHVSGKVFKIVSNISTPTETQMFNAVGAYSGFNAVSQAVTSLTETCEEAKTQIKEIKEYATEAKKAAPSVLATLADVKTAAESISEMKQDVKEVGTTFSKWGKITDELRASISTIVPSVMSAVKEFLTGALNVGKYTVAALVIVGVFKLLHTLLEMLPKETQVLILKIVGSGLLIAGMAGAAYHLAGEQLIMFADKLKSTVSAARENWDKASVDCFPEFENLKRVKKMFSMESFELNVNSGIQLRRSQQMFRFKQHCHTVRRCLYDLYVESGITDKIRIAFNALFYVNSPGIPSEEFDKLQAMVFDGASSKDIMNQISKNKDYFVHVAFANTKEAQEVTLDTEIGDQNIKTIIEASQDLGDKLSILSSSVLCRFKGSLSKLAEQKHDPIEFQGVNRDGPNSLLALMLVILRKIQNPDKAIIDHFNSLRKESNNFKVLTSAGECMWEVLPNDLRVSAYEAFGLGEPTDVPRQVVEMLCSCHQMLGEVVLAEHRTSKFKQMYLTRFDELQKKLMDPIFYTKKEGFTYALLTSAFNKMSDKLHFLDDVSDNNGHRVQTLCLWFEGMPGLGKSRMMDALAQRFAPDYPVDNRVFTWNLQEEYMSGYNKQWALDVDDVGSNPLALAKSGFFQDLMTKASSKKCTVVKAYEKGSLFDTHVVGLSSNETMGTILRGQVDQGVLSNPEAVLRRVSGRNGMHIKMKPSDPKFTRMLGENKVGDVIAIIAQSEEDKENFAHVIFEIGGQDYSFDGLCARFGVLYKSVLKEYSEALEKASYVPDTRYAAFTRNLRKQFKVDPFPTQLQMQGSHSNQRKPSRNQRNYNKGKKHQKNKPKLNPNIKHGGSAFEGWPKTRGKFTGERKIQRHNTRLANKLFHCSSEQIREMTAKAKAEGRPADMEFQAKEKRQENDDEVIREFKKEAKETAASIEQDDSCELAYSLGVDEQFINQITKPEIQRIELKYARLEEAEKKAAIIESRKWALKNIADSKDFRPPWRDFCSTKWKSILRTVEAGVSAGANVDWALFGKYMAPILGIIGAISVAYKAAGWLSKDSPKLTDEEQLGFMAGAPAVYHPDGEFDYRPSGRARNHGHRFKNGFNRDKRNPTKLHAKMEPRNRLPNFMTKLNKCTVKFCNKPEFDPESTGWAVFVRDKHMLLNRHYVTGNNGMVFGNMFTYELQGQLFNSVFREKDVRVLKDKNGAETDLIIWRVNARNGQSSISTPQIMQFFQYEDEVRQDFWSTDKAPIFVMAHYMNGLDSQKVAKLETTTSKNWPLKYTSGEQVESDRAFLYSGRFVKGDCGKLVVKEKIRGVHIAGRTGVLGTAQVVTREMLHSAFDFQTAMDVPLLDESSHEELPLGSYHSERSDMRGMPVEGEFIAFASVPIPSTIAHATRLEKTGMPEVGSVWAAKCDKVPAILGVDDERYNGSASLNCQFMADRMERYAVRPPDVPDLLLSAAVSKLVRAVPPGNTPIRTWTVHEALNPRKIDSVLQPLKRSTGSGWGFKGKGKYEQIGFDPDTDTYFAQGELIPKMKRVHELLDQGKNPLFIYSEFPKDEILKPSKIESKCCRTVSASPLDLTVFSKQAFGAFIDSWQRVPIQWGHANGLDVLSQDWDMIMKELGKKGTHGFDSDFKKFDSTMSKQFMVKFWYEVDSWYKRNGSWDLRSSLMRWIVIYNMVHSKHIIGRTIIMMLMGLPSGSLLTTIMNCFWAKTLLLVGYALLAPASIDGRIIPLTFDGYDANVKSFVLGDDNVSSVSERVGKWYNAKALSMVLEKYNIIITPALKNTELSCKNRKITELEFLACTTRIGNEVSGWRFYPVIKDDSLSKALCYARVKADFPMVKALDSNIFNSLLRLFGSGRERYEDFYDDVVSAFYELYPEATVEFPSYDETLLAHRVDDRFLEAQPFDPMLEAEQTGLIFMSTMDIPTTQNITTGYDTAVSMESKASPQGVQSIVDMPIVETPQTLRVLLRRNYAVMAEASGHVKDFLWANLGSVFGNHNGSPDQFQSPLSKVGSWFRVWSGPLHVVAYSEQSMSLSYLPGQNVSPSSTSGIFDVAIPTNASSYGGGYNFAPASIGYVNAKLPFTTVFHSLKIPHFADDVLDETNCGAIVVRTDDQSEKIAVTITTGDDFDMGVRYLCPRIRVAAVNLAPDTYPSALQGITVSKSNYNVSDVQSSGVEMNPTSTTETTSDTKLDAKAGNDAPNVPTQLANVLRQTSAYGSSAQRVNFDPSLTITNEMQPGDLSTANTHDVMPLRELVRPTAVRTIAWSTSDAPGDVLLTGVISPSDNVTNLTLNSDTQHTALSTLSTMYGYWRGPYKKGFSVVISGVHVGRLGFACLYGQTTVPVGLSELTSQRYSVFEVNAESNVHVVEIPYVSTKRVLETYHGQTNQEKYSTGVWALFVMNSLRAPAAASSTVDIVVSEGGAEGLQFIVPFANNRSLTFGHVYDAESQRGRRKETKHHEMPAELQSDMGVPIANGEEKIGVVMADSTDVGGSAHDDVPGTHDTKIVRQPFLNYIDMLSRDQWIANFDWSTSKSIASAPLYSRGVPFGMLTNTAQRAMNSFRQVKTTAVITAKLTASTFHSGRCILVALPMTTESQMNAVLGTASTAYARTIAPTYPNHVFLDAGASTSVEFRIPFQYFKSYLETDENYAHFQLKVYTPLRVGTGGSLTASITLYVRFEQTELRVIEPL